MPQNVIRGRWLLNPQWLELSQCQHPLHCLRHIPALVGIHHLEAEVLHSRGRPSDHLPAAFEGSSAQPAVLTNGTKGQSSSLGPWLRYNRLEEIHHGVFQKPRGVWAMRSVHWPRSSGPLPLVVHTPLPFAKQTHF